MSQDADFKGVLKSLERRLNAIYLVAFVILFLMSMSSNYMMKSQTAQQATSFIKRLVVRGDYREAIYTLNDAKLDNFSAVIYYAGGRRLFSLPPHLDLDDVAKPNVFTQLWKPQIRADVFFDEAKTQKIGSIVFVFSPFSHAPYAFIIWLSFLLATLPLVRSSKKRAIANHLREIALRDEVAKADLARKVRHDIRSPLGALRIAISALGEPTPQTDLVRRATDRIAEIVAELELLRGPSVKPNAAGIGAENHALLPSVQEIVQEKRVRLGIDSKITINPVFDEAAFITRAKINPIEFRRSLSNLIDNAIEAVGPQGKIEVAILASNKEVVLRITDDGCGMSSAAQHRLGAKGFTTKANGSGLGFYYAKMMVETAAGSIQVESREGDGTRVFIRLPRCANPSWHRDTVSVPKEGAVVIVDDQDSMHFSLGMRLKELRKSSGASFQIVNLKTAEEFRSWRREADPSLPVRYLFDFDLGNGGPTGLDLILEARIATEAILVTGHFDSEDVQKKCLASNLGLIAKPTLSQVTLSVS